MYRWSAATPPEGPTCTHFHGGVNCVAQVHRTTTGLSPCDSARTHTDDVHTRTWYFPRLTTRLAL